MRARAARSVSGPGDLSHAVEPGRHDPPSEAVEAHHNGSEDDRVLRDRPALGVAGSEQRRLFLGCGEVGKVGRAVLAEARANPAALAGEAMRRRASSSRCVRSGGAPAIVQLTASRSKRNSTARCQRVLPAGGRREVLAARDPGVAGTRRGLMAPRSTITFPRRRRTRCRRAQPLAAPRHQSRRSRSMRRAATCPRPSRS